MRFLHNSLSQFRLVLYTVTVQQSMTNKFTEKKVVPLETQSSLNVAIYSMFVPSAETHIAFDMIVN